MKYHINGKNWRSGEFTIYGKVVETGLALKEGSWVKKL
jgi:hypothetical protein